MSRLCRSQWAPPTFTSSSEAEPEHVLVPTEKEEGSAPLPMSKPTHTDYIVTATRAWEGFAALPHLQTIEAGSVALQMS